jgi:hypothetical protein
VPSAQASVSSALLAGFSAWHFNSYRCARQLSAKSLKKVVSACHQRPFGGLTLATVPVPLTTKFPFRLPVAEAISSLTSISEVVSQRRPTAYNANLPRLGTHRPAIPQHACVAGRREKIRGQCAEGLSPG